MADLERIRCPGVTVAILERPLPSDLAGAMARPVHLRRFAGIRLETTARRARAELAGALAEAGLNGAPVRDAPVRDALVRDVARLADVFAGITGAATLRVRLEPVPGDGCKYFHADSVGIRLLCTYRGPGTWWLPDDAVERPALGSGDNAAVVRDPARIQVLGAGHVALLKGDAWPGNRGRGAVHRSPPADRGAGPRLLLSIDHETD
ncbi:DUF1826 domain-containing protein (plasmid) [Skermanella rosea]|uniref:DUF1826 domain-containing protein n=1 Tax=Skermanella rosea TaxID=1817965 RepID=UPI00193471A0|nr:DUF1826 domain-containing protein [Skermanella rosea]UEM07833.1 DUF1826 domain-containing protein [Skermanella rosea]